MGGCEKEFWRLVVFMDVIDRGRLLEERRSRVARRVRRLLKSRGVEPPEWRLYIRFAMRLLNTPRRRLDEARLGELVERYVGMGADRTLLLEVAELVRRFKNPGPRPQP